jgi:hypothetical protein
MNQTTRRVLWTVVAWILPIGVAAQPKPSTSFTVVAGQQFGPIRETTSRAELQSLFRGAVKDADVYLGEGFCTPGTLVLPGTLDEIEVAWQDAARSRVAFVRATKTGGRWRTARGVRIGTPLPDLVRLAGKALTFSGFGWDYGGRLESEQGASMVLSLMLNWDNTLATSPRANEIKGDREVRSDHPIVTRARITVDEMLLSWGHHAGEQDCG